MLLALSTFGLAREYAGVGVICCGDLWDTFVPSAHAKYSSESNTDVTRNYCAMRMGNLERQWTTPTQMYPGGDKLHLPWAQNFFMTEYSQSEINNYTTDADPRAKNFVNAFWMPTLQGAVTSNADSKGAVPWKDDARTGMIYEASQPTNIGVDMKFRVRANTLNEANMNDWVMMEVELTNTGKPDYNCDGVIDAQNHKIEALSFASSNEVIGSMYNNTSGNRWNAAWLKSRMSGYDGSPDPDGNPWDVPVVYGSNCDPATIDANGWAPDGMRYVGYIHGRAVPRDLWSGFHFIAVKKGSMSGGAAAEDKETIYGTHPIGEGAERGWYTTVNRTMLGFGTGYGRFLEATGVWYEDGGRTWNSIALNAVKPDPNFFDTTKPYTAGDPLSFVGIEKPEGSRGRPNGDQKYTGKWLQNWEKNYPGTPSPGIPAADQWTAGGTPPTYHNFDGDRYVGVGPFSLDVGETITVVWVEYAGYRLKGARQSMKSARWAYENDFNIPEPPPMPDLMVKAVQTPSGEFKAKIIWDQRAEAADDFAGYKIYRVTAFPKIDFSILQHRWFETYHHQNASDIGATDAELESKYSKTVNPNKSIPADYKLEWDPSAAGPWKIQAYITKDQLATYAVNTDEDAGTYPYEWVDTSAEVKDGYTYWYYVAAFDNESGTMAGVTYNHLESGKDNWNGRDGRWYGCYYYAPGASEYPTVDLGAQKFLGANFVLKPARVDKDVLISGALKIGVKPNPYKVQAPHDVGNEHKVQFFNLTADTRITILDLSGQIMNVLEYEGANPADGSVFWDMFTKDGPEVASGLYIWMAEYPGGQQTGYLAIQR